MNSSEIQSLIVKILLMVLSPVAAKYHVDGNLVPAIAADVADLLVLAYGVYSHWNMKKVPELSTAVVLVPAGGSGPLPVGSGVALAGGTTVKVVGALLAGFLIMQALPSYAQNKRPLTGNLFNDIQGAGTAIAAKQTQDITQFLTDLADISGAITLSTQIPGLQDPVGNACWLQFNGIGELLKAHPSPLNLKVASDWEALRLLAIGLNQVCANPNCGQMFVDATNAVSALAPIPSGLSLQSICSKVPVIGTSAVPTAAAPTAGVGTVTAPVVLPAKP